MQNYRIGFCVIVGERHGVKVVISGWNGIQEELECVNLVMTYLPLQCNKRMKKVYDLLVVYFNHQMINLSQLSFCKLGLNPSLFIINPSTQ